MPTAYYGTATAPEVRGVTAPSATPSTPSGTQVGDLILAFFFDRGGSNGYALNAGWTMLVDQSMVEEAEVPEEGFSDGLSVAYKIATVAGAAVQSPSNATLHGLVVLKKETFDAEDLEGRVVFGYSEDTTGAPNPPAIITQVENCLVFAVGYWHLGSSATVSVTPPTGYTEAWEMSGSNLNELSVAYKTVALSASENPAAFADDVTPESTIALTFAIRPSGWAAEVPVPVRGDARTQANFQPAWQRCADRERFILDRAPTHHVFADSDDETPILDYPGNATANEPSGDDNVEVEVENCIVGDKVLVDVTLEYNLAGDWENTNVTAYWSVKIQATDDIDGTPKARLLDGAHFFGPIGEAPQMGKRRHVRMVGVHRVRRKGTTRLELFTTLAANAGENNHSFEVYSVQIAATRFPSASAPIAPNLVSFDVDLADTLGGDVVTVRGTGLGGATSLTVGGTGATILENASTYIRFTMPAKSAGNHNVVVTTPYGTSNSLPIEAWNPGVESYVIAFGERPDYATTAGTGGLNNGTWTLRKGTSWSRTSEGIKGAPTASAGAPVWGSGSVEYLTGPALNTLFDLTGASSGSCGFVVAPASGPSNSPIFADGAGAEKYDLFYLNSGQFQAHITTDVGPKYVNAAPDNTNVASTYHSVLVRFADGAGGTGTLEMTVNGGTGGYGEGVFAEAGGEGFSTLTGCSDATVLGTDTNLTALSSTLGMRAFFFANTKVSDAFTTKFLKWAHIRHDSAPLA